MTKAQNLIQRRYDLDWLRVIAILLVLLYHVGMFFVPWDFHLKNNETSRTFGYIMTWMHNWRMPLLLFISGAGTVFASSRRNAFQFAKERHNRLMIPLLFAMFVIVPPQIYLEKIKDFASYLDFYPSVFSFIPYPEGGSLSWHHMWFVLYLFIFSIIVIPLIIFLKSEKSIIFLNRIEKYLSRKWGFMSYIIIILLSQIILKPYFPEETHSLIDDWAYFTLCFTYFLAGIIVASSDNLWKSLYRYRRFHLYWALLSLSIIEFMYAIDWNLIQPYFTLDLQIIWDINEIVIGWAWVITIIGYGQKYLNKKSNIIKHANEGIYPFYILHQTVILILAFPMINWEHGIFFKFILLTLSSLIITILLYLVLIRPFNIMRFLFGMKPKRKPARVW